MNSKWTSTGKVLAEKADFKEVGLNFVGSTEPTNPEEGQAWYDSTNKVIQWYNGSNWASTVFIGTAAPGTPVEGSLWYDTTANVFEVYHGSTWTIIGPPNSTTLDTDTEELSYDITDESTHLFTLSSPGEYGFFPQTKWEAGVGVKGVTYGGGSSNSGGTSYTSEIAMSHTTGSDKYGYVQTRYVTSSGNIGWLFLLKEKGQVRIKGSYFCFDHPCWGRGGDPEEWPHPWKNLYDPQKHEIFCVTMSREEALAISNQNAKKSILELINEQYEIDEQNQSLWPNKEIPVRAIKDIGHVKKIVKKPDYIKMAGIRIHHH